MMVKTQRYMTLGVLLMMVGWSGACDDDSNGDLDPVDMGQLADIGHSDERPENAGVCQWSMGPTVFASGQTVHLGDVESGVLGEPSRELRFENQDDDVILIDTPARVWAGTGGEFALVCGRDAAVDATVPTNDAAGGCVDGSEITVDVTGDAGAWQGTVRVEESAFEAMPDPLSGTFQLSFLARERSAGGPAACD